MKTIEQKAQAYDEALERARMINNGEDVDIEAGTTTCEYIFPELKESEDEKIRQYLITYFSNIDDCASNLKGKDVVAWLEKQQGGKDKFTQQHSLKEDSNVNDETNAPTEYGKYVDECLNEASKHFFSEGEDKYSVADLFYAGVRCGQSWLEKQGEKEYALKSSKDEDVHKFVQYIEKQAKAYELNLPNRSYDIYGFAKDILAWLEKQDFTWSEEDERMYSIVFEEYKNRQYYSHPNLESRDINGEILDWFKSIKQRIGG